MTAYHIDTDMGVDDLLALVVAARLFGTSLVAVSTVFGNVAVEVATRNALIVRHLLGRQTSLDIFQGASSALDGFCSDAREIHGDDGLGGATAALDPELLRAIERDPKPRAISDNGTVRSRQPAITLVGLGPATNIPQLIDLYGKENIERIVLMSSVFFDCGNVTPDAEFNAHCDPYALRITLDSGLPVTLVPLDVCRKVQLSRTAVRSYSATDNSPLMQLVISSHMRYMDGYQEAEGIDACFPHDAIAVLAARMPERFWRTRGKVHVDVANQKRGRTTISLDSSSTVEVVTGGNLKWVRDGLASLNFK
jgi:inosine-uridine nucleoside N-ribohydrolase